MRMLCFVADLLLSLFCIPTSNRVPWYQWSRIYQFDRRLTRSRRLAVHHQDELKSIVRWT